jgi:hypothetical protein
MALLQPGTETTTKRGPAMTIAVVTDQAIPRGRGQHD